MVDWDCYKLHHHRIKTYHMLPPIDGTGIYNMLWLQQHVQKSTASTYIICSIMAASKLCISDTTQSTKFCPACLHYLHSIWIYTEVTTNWDTKTVVDREDLSAITTNLHRAVCANTRSFIILLPISHIQCRVTPIPGFASSFNPLTGALQFHILHLLVLLLASDVVNQVFQGVTMVLGVLQSSSAMETALSIVTSLHTRRLLCLLAKMLQHMELLCRKIEY